MRQVEVRRARDDDRPEVLDLMRTALGWKAGDHNDELFRWKHDEGVFGRSPAWVAVHEGDVVGFRTFMRWEFDAGGSVVTAVRAVDTATHPSHQGRGIFRTLTLAALEELRAEGVQLVFNTPNDQSRPGYLKMGWVPVGVLPVALRLRHASGLLRVMRARTPAQLWSERPAGGEPLDALLREPALASCLEHQSPASGLRTRRSVGYLRWRYGLAGLHYRAFRLPGGLQHGFVVFRVRRRGAALECAVAELAARPGARTAAALVRGALRASGADYAVALRAGMRARGMLPVPRQGPMLVARPLATGAVVPPAAEWRLSLGDVELF